MKLGTGLLAATSQWGGRLSSMRAAVAIAST